MSTIHDDLVPILNKKWTIRKGGQKSILFNYKEGLSEERYLLSGSNFGLLRLCDGGHSVGEIRKLAGSGSITQLGELNSLEIDLVNFVSSKQCPREFVDSYPGKDYLGRVLFHITSRCNANCKHCYIGGIDWGDELTEKDIFNVIGQLREMNCYAVSITGGEPLIQKNLVEIIREFDRNEIKIEGLFTNGTLLNKENITKIESIQEIPLFVSLNGPLMEVQEKFMSMNDVYDLIVKNIKIAISMGVKVFANTSLSVLNDDSKIIDEFYSLVKSLGIYRWRISRPFMKGNWVNNRSKFGITLENELKILSKVFELWESDERPFDLELGHVMRYISGEYRQMDYQLGDYACDYYRERITILPNGDVSACPILIQKPFVVGNLKKEKLKDIWESPKMRYFKDLKIGDVVEKKCNKCKYLSECGFGCRAWAVMTGNKYEDLDPEMCNTCFNPEYQKLRLKIEKVMK